MNELCIETEVKHILINVLYLPVTVDDLKSDSLLLDGGLGFNSRVGLEIILGLEERFGFEFEVEDLTRDVFFSVGTLTDLVRSKLQA